ncbi:MAG: gluconokinase [Microcoleaceae cyanobacterium]
MIIIVIGVSGSGKTTVGEKLAEILQYEFKDADDFHPLENIEKMSQKIPLNDRDRQPWLQTLQKEIQQWLAQNQNVVLACSALKQNYRKQLLINSEQMRLVYLKGSFELIENRLKQRSDHYMKADLLQSQFKDLEEPSTAIKIEISQPIEKIVEKIQAQL